MTTRSTMMNVISTLMHWLEQRSTRTIGTDEVARREPLSDLEPGIDEAAWLQRYLFDREWRADIESVSQSI